MLAPRRRMTPRKGFIFMIIALVLLAAGILLNMSAPRGVGAFFARIAQPIWQVGAKFSQNATVLEAFRSKRDLAEENARLRDDLRDARLLLSDRRTLIEENRTLKGISEGASTTPGMIAAVLARPAITPYDTLIIEGGAHDGVVTGSRVFVGDSIVLGTIEDVFSDSARVRLFSSPGVETEVVLPESDITTTARGMGDGTFTIRIPSAIDVTAGASVTLPGGSVRILGFVDSVDVSSGDLFQTVWFRVPVGL